MSFRSSIRTVEVAGVVSTGATGGSGGGGGGGGGGTLTAGFVRSGATSAGPADNFFLSTPATAQAGDLLICALLTDGASDPTPSGWNQGPFLSTTGSGTSPFLKVYNRTATSADAAGAGSYVFGGGPNASAIMIATTGWVFQANSVTGPVVAGFTSSPGNGFSLAANSGRHLVISAGPAASGGLTLALTGATPPTVYDVAQKSSTPSVARLLQIRALEMDATARVLDYTNTTDNRMNTLLLRP